MTFKQFYRKVENHIINDLGRLGMFDKISDELYLKKRFKRKIGMKLDIENPKTFNQKLQWLKLYDRNPDYIKMVDKYDVKEYVKNIIGEKYIIPTIGVWDRFEDIDFASLPNRFVLKCTHDSGGVVVCHNKNNLNKNTIKKKINKSLRRNYFYVGREWPYKHLKPRIIVEENIQPENVVTQINDYKLMCFHGKVKCSFVCSNRNSDMGLCVNFYDSNWSPMPFERHYQRNPKEIEKPKNYQEMVSLAETLSKNIPFVRVDFYEVEGKIYFGELTFYPGGGMEEFNPVKWDYTLGSWIDLSRVGK